MAKTAASERTGTCGAKTALLLCALLGVTLTASCATRVTERQRAEAIPGVQINIKRTALSSSMLEYALEFAAVVEQAADRIAAETDSPEVRRAALRWKMNAIPEARIACYRHDPVGAQSDMWTLALQMEALFTTGAGATVFGEQQHIAVEASSSLVRNIRAIGRWYSGTEESLAIIEREEIAPWVESHPITSLAFQRHSSILRYADLAKEQGGTLSQVASMEEYFSKLVAMFRVAIAEVPRQARWHAQLLIEESIGDLGIDQIAASIDQIAASTRSAAVVADSAPDIVIRERQAVMSELREQTGSVVREIDQMRLRTIDEVRTEREALTTEIDRIVDEAVASAISDGSGAVGAVADRTADRVVERLFMRIILLAIIGIVLAPVLAHVYVRVWPKPRA